MSLAIAHFALGAAMTTLIVTFLLPTVRYPRTLALAGGVWAMLPDLYWVSPVARETLYTLHQTSLWTDLFWFHRTMDRLDPTDSKAVAAAFLAFYALTTVIAERRSYRTPDVLASAYESYLETEPSERS